MSKDPAAQKDIALSAENMSAVLGRYANATSFYDLPESVRHEGTRALLHYIGCGLGGHDHESASAIADALVPVSGSGTSHLIGRKTKTNMLVAALTNATAASAHSFDDTHAEAIVHPSGSVAAALLALSGVRAISGQDFLTAFILGVEVMCRVSKALSVSPAQNNLAWSQTGVCSGVGTAVAVGKILGLDADQLVAAMGIAASEAGGMRAMQGTMCMPMLSGHGAESGLRAAFLSLHGMTSAPDIMNCKHGFLEVFSAGSHAEHLVNGLGEHYEISKLTYKAYPCGVVLQVLVDACLALREELPDGPDAIEAMQVRVNPVALALTNRRHPLNRTEAQVSLHHWAAVAAIYGKAGLPQGTQDEIDNINVAQMRDRIEPIADESVPQGQVILDVALRNGQMRSRHVDNYRGSVTHPLSDTDLEEKCRSQGAFLPVEQMDELIRNCWDLPALATCAVIASNSSLR